MTAIVVSELVHRYASGVLALDGVSLAIGQDVVAVVGENGAGKTTLVKHLNGLLEPTQGEVLVDGRSTTGQSVASLARSVGLVFQNPNDQIFNASVRDEVAFGPRNLGFPPERVAETVERSLRLVELWERADEHPYGLTLSERKLLCIAAVVAMDTPIVVLDEPTTGQDRRGVQRIGALVEHLRARGCTVVAITHDMALVAAAFDRTVVMAQGKVVLDGPTRQVFARPDVLRAAGVEPPPATDLAQRLGLPETPLTVAEFCAAYQRARTVEPARAPLIPIAGG